MPKTASCAIFAPTPFSFAQLVNSALIFPMLIAYSVEDIHRLVGEGRVEGTATKPVSSIAALKQAKPGDLAFLGNLKYKADVPGCRASVILVPEDYEGHPAPGQAFIRLPKPSHALARICREVERMLWPKPAPGVHPSAVVQPGAQVDATAHVGPLCVVEAGAQVGPGAVLQAQVYLGRGSRVGQDSWLMPQVTVMEYCVIGRRVRLLSGVVIGGDGFGYDTNSQGVHEKVPQIGRVVIEDDVELGANVTVDRARFNETRVGEGTKIDNLTQVAHNVIIGKHCLVAALVGISGSTTLEESVIIGGQAGLAGHIRIGARSQIGGQSGVIHDLPPESRVRDSPSMPYLVAQKVHILKSRLPELFKRVASLEETAAQLGANGPAPSRRNKED
jgi:UDP-3-O-[3-hydroxymyristoyl] glucosamine N-acyltransferase